jgi:hypothetical protein
MYIFVRFAAINTIIFGVLAMLFGAGTAIYGFVQNDAVTAYVNNTLMPGSGGMLSNTYFYSAVAALVLFLLGLGLSALGQMMLVFVDLANHTRETNAILRTFRPRRSNAGAEEASSEETA